MKQLGSAEFRRGYASESEPVEVTAYGKVIGTWYPSGADLPTTDAEQPADDERGFDTPAPRMTIRPDKTDGRRMVATEKRVIDPLDFRRRERDNYSALHRQMYGGKGPKSGPHSG